MLLGKDIFVTVIHKNENTEFTPKIGTDRPEQTL